MDNPNGRQFVFRFGVLLSILVLVYLFDATLAKVDRAETRAIAAGQYGAGTQAMRAGDFRSAVEHLREATNLDRSNPDYSIALSSAILETGRVDAAEALLQPVLERNATNGAANLAMARALVKEKRMDEAKSYYHRAIYGIWRGDAEQRRTKARFELIDFLARFGTKQEILAELFTVEAASTLDEVARRRVAHLLLAAGAPERAAVIFREMLRAAPQDADAYAGMGESALSRGNLLTARSDFSEARRLAPHDSSFVAREAVADSALALDPLQLRLGVAEQFRRARNVVKMTIASVRACGQLAPLTAQVLDSADRVVAAKPRTAALDSAAESDIALAAEVWKYRPARCAVTETHETALAAVQARLAQ